MLDIEHTAYSQPLSLVRHELFSYISERIKEQTINWNGTIFNVVTDGHV